MAQWCRIKNYLLTLVCNIIKYSISNNSKHHKIDKKQLVCEILTAPFELNPQEIQQLKDRIDFLYNNNKIVKYNQTIKFIKNLLLKAGINLPNINI